MASSNSPYSTALASGNIDFDFENALNPSEQMKKYKTEEENAKASHTLPHEFGDLPQHLAIIVDNAFQASSNLNNVLKMEDYKRNKQLTKLKNNLEKIVMYLMKNGDKTLSNFVIAPDKN
jgi:hypothetical protein